MIDYILWIVLIISFITDLSKRKILNIITLPTIVIGLIYHSVIDGWSGLLFSGQGFLLGLGLLLIPFVLGGMGAGDVKLLAAVGAMKGAGFVFSSFLFMAMAGGVMALVVLIVRKELKYLLFRFFLFLTVDKGKIQPIHPSAKEKGYTLPYGVAIAAGVFLAYYLGGVFDA
ncbi:prepilin peptidase [Ammoniphilus sp. 3BR4]|uniref:A24 family peptidase n=1 Tax=Ammoniphilus sp. 3BR4 TaxID=3158265 RepID=UPI003467087C